MIHRCPSSANIRTMFQWHINLKGELIIQKAFCNYLSTAVVWSVFSYKTQSFLSPNSFINGLIADFVCRLQLNKVGSKKNTKKNHRLFTCSQWGMKSCRSLRLIKSAPRLCADRFCCKLLQLCEIMNWFDVLVCSKLFAHSNFVFQLRFCTQHLCWRALFKLLVPIRNKHTCIVLISSLKANAGPNAQWVFSSFALLRGGVCVGIHSLIMGMPRHWFFISNKYALLIAKHHIKSSDPTFYSSMNCTQNGKAWMDYWRGIPGTGSRGQVVPEPEPLCEC